MAILVTGATGALGQVMVARLLAEGRAVRILTRRPFRADTVFGDSVSAHEWHPLSEPVPKEALEGVTGIIHLMGAPFAGGPTRGRAELAEQSRVETTQRLIDAIEGRDIRLIIASVALAPDADNDGASITEAALGGGMGAATANSADLPWEAEALGALAQGKSVAVVRLGLMAGQGAVLGSLVGLAAYNVELDLEGALIPAIDPADAAAMLSGLIDRADMTGHFFGVAPIPVAGEAVMEALEKARSLPIPLPLTAPLPMTKRLLARRIGVLAPLLTHTRRIQPFRLAQAGAQFATPDPTALLVKAIAETIEVRRGAKPDWAVRRPAGRVRAPNKTDVPATAAKAEAGPAAVEAVDHSSNVQQAPSDLGVRDAKISS